MNVGLGEDRVRGYRSSSASYFTREKAWGLLPLAFPIHVYIAVLYLPHGLDIDWPGFRLPHYQHYNATCVDSVLRLITHISRRSTAPNGFHSSASSTRITLGNRDFHRDS